MNEDTTPPWDAPTEPPQQAPDIEAQLRAAAQSRPVQPKRRNPWPFIAAGVLIVLGTVTLVTGLITGGSDTADAVRPPTTVERHAPPSTDGEPEHGTGQDFLDAFREEQSGNMDDVRVEMQAVVDASEDYDFDRVSSHAGEVRGIFSEMHDASLDMPGADSEVGRTYVHTFATCRDAYASSARVMDNLEINDQTVDKLEALTAEIKGCNDAIDDATSATEDVNGGVEFD